MQYLVKVTIVANILFERVHDDGRLSWLLVCATLTVLTWQKPPLTKRFTAYSVNPHGRKSMYALLIGIGSYLFLSVSMWSCVYVKIDGYLEAEFPFIERVSTDVRYAKNECRNQTF